MLLRNRDFYRGLQNLALEGVPAARYLGNVLVLILLDAPRVVRLVVTPRKGSQ